MADCPICMAQAECYHGNLYDDRYACPGMFNLYCCCKCGHSFLDISPGSPAIERLYTDYYPRAVLNLDEFKPKSFPGGLRSWLNGDACSACKWIPPNVKILDIGCGFCETLAYHQGRGCDVCGVEVDENVKRVAEKYHFDVHVGLFNPDLYAPESFDYVTLQQVIEHVDAPLETLQGVAKVLRPGGRAVLTTPNAHGWGAGTFGKRWINWHAPYHRHFFSEESMQRVAQEAGLVVHSVQTITSSEWLGYQWIHLFCFPVAGESSPFWSPCADRELSIRVLQKLSRVLHYFRINHLLTRFFDRLGMGDNFLFILEKP